MSYSTQPEEHSSGRPSVQERVSPDIPSVRGLAYRYLIRPTLVLLKLAACADVPGSVVRHIGPVKFGGLTNIIPRAELLPEDGLTPEDRFLNAGFSDAEKCRHLRDTRIAWFGSLLVALTPIICVGVNMERHTALYFAMPILAWMIHLGFLHYNFRNGRMVLPGRERKKALLAWLGNPSEWIPTHEENAPCRSF